ncbi:MAG: hypothetical protein AAB267_01330, partial [Candidatus Desantisbacteria bacterium]
VYDKDNSRLVTTIKIYELGITEPMTEKKVYYELKEDKLVKVIETSEYGVLNASSKQYIYWDRRATHDSNGEERVVRVIENFETYEGELYRESVQYIYNKVENVQGPVSRVIQAIETYTYYGTGRDDKVLDVIQYTHKEVSNNRIVTVLRNFYDAGDGAIYLDTVQHNYTKPDDQDLSAKRVVQVSETYFSTGVEGETTLDYVQYSHKEIVTKDGKPTAVRVSRIFYEINSQLYLERYTESYKAMVESKLDGKKYETTVIKNFIINNDTKIVDSVQYSYRKIDEKGRFVNYTETYVSFNGDMYFESYQKSYYSMETINYQALSKLVRVVENYTMLEGVKDGIKESEQYVYYDVRDGKRVRVIENYSYYGDINAPERTLSSVQYAYNIFEGGKAFRAVDTYDVIGSQEPGKSVYIGVSREITTWEYKYSDSDRKQELVRVVTNFDRINLNGQEAFI